MWVLFCRNCRQKDGQATAAAECSLSSKEVLSSSPTIQSTVHSPAVRPVDLSPLPVMKTDKQKQRKSRCSQASDLTSTPYKKLLESRPSNVKRKKSVSRSLAGEMAKKKRKTDQAMHIKYWFFLQLLVNIVKLK